MRVVVYTALVGDIDYLWSVVPRRDDIQHVAFVDSPKQEIGLWGEEPPTITSRAPAMVPTWEQRVIEPQWGNRRTARHVKTLAHRYLPDADVWVWIDANVRPRMPSLALIGKYISGDLVTFDHWARRCLYDEAAVCIQQEKDRSGVLKPQVERYRRAGMPRNWGLAATRIVIRRNTKAVRELNETWWAEIERGSVRDQVSLPFASWQSGLHWESLPGTCKPGNPDSRWLYLGHRA